MAEELKPCPFCGSSELLGFEASHEGGWTIVKCRKCGCSGSTGGSTSEQEATAFWNRRATHPAPAEQVEVVAWQDAENPLYTTAERRVMHEWAGNQYPIVELMTVAQHNRIVAALSAQQSAPERVSVPVELLRSVCSNLPEKMKPARRELRALLNGGEA